MENNIQFKSQIFHYSTNIFLKPFLESTISLPIFIVSPLLSPKTQIQKPITYACNSLISVVSKTMRQRWVKGVTAQEEVKEEMAQPLDLKILPQPLDLIVQNLLVADEVRLGFLNGLNGVRF
ncbi:hypothetical protein Gotur_026382, partial [Gossypium turneri]